MVKTVAEYSYDHGMGECEHKIRRLSTTAADGSFIIVYIGNEETDFELELTWLAEHPQKYDLGEEKFHLAFRTDLRSYR